MAFFDGCFNAFLLTLSSWAVVSGNADPGLFVYAVVWKNHR